MCLWIAVGILMWAETVYGTSPSKAATAPTPPHDWYVPLPEPPEMFRAEPAVAEAERVLKR